MDELVTHVLPSDLWKQTRDRLAQRTRRNLHQQETNPGPDFRLRFDYVVTASEVTVLIEQIMRETERVVLHYLDYDKRKPAAAVATTKK
jgi:hypothetical protein